MYLTIHRGTHQIGGCVTEIATAATRIFIDFGAELPGPNGAVRPETLSIPGLTEGEPHCQGVFFTHIHGDHIGNLHRILPGVPLYMGRAAKAISLVLNRQLDTVMDRGPQLAALGRAEVFTAGVPVPVGDITVTPIWVDHSAFDAYMFLIEAEGVRVLHTGDFRGHGLHGGSLIRALRAYARDVDWLITEGTMLSRPDEQVRSEQELLAEARRFLAEHKRVFVLCSSTNVDRIRAFCQARPDRRPIVCDRYQKKILDVVEANAPDWLGGYDFRSVIPDAGWNDKLHNWMAERGFLMFVRPNDHFRAVMEPYQGRCKVIYSMWNGYREGPMQQAQIVKFLEGFVVIPLHTSGHVTPADLRRVYAAVRPRRGVIPMHTENPAGFRNIVPEEQLRFLGDGERMRLDETDAAG